MQAAGPVTAKTPSACPLLQVRMLEGVACLPGVDTLLLLLLADLGDARQVAAFAAMPSQVDVAAVEQRLQVRSARAWQQGCCCFISRAGRAGLAWPGGVLLQPSLADLLLHTFCPPAGRALAPCPGHVARGAGWR